MNFQYMVIARDGMMYEHVTTMTSMMGAKDLCGTIKMVEGRDAFVVAR
jgi:hypothetical protein